jgi:hypothetical protein
VDDYASGKAKKPKKAIKKDRATVVLEDILSSKVGGVVTLSSDEYTSITSGPIKTSEPYTVAGELYDMYRASSEAEYKKLLENFRKLEGVYLEEVHNTIDLQQKLDEANRKLAAIELTILRDRHENESV